MAWTTPRTWVTSEVVTAALMNAHVRDNLTALNGYVLKTADQSITSSAVLTNDTHLLYTIPAAGSYLFDAYLFATSAANAAGDMQVSFTFPTGTCHWGGHALDSAIASAQIASLDAGGFTAATSGVTAHGAGLSTTTTLQWYHGVLIATASGTLRLQWAQLASNANATTLKTGSHMRVQQVA